jgi:hypothetical protein
MDMMLFCFHRLRDQYFRYDDLVLLNVVVDMTLFISCRHIGSLLNAVI